MVSRRKSNGIKGLPNGAGYLEEADQEVNPMDFGIFLDFPTYGGSHEDAFRETFELVDLADGLGLDTVWLGETHFTPERAVHSAQMVIASAIASRTKQLRVGSAVHVLPLVHPLRIAEEAATVDQISKGRLDFGVGRSGLTRYYKGYNIDYSESSARFLEAMDVITKAWNDEPFSHEGEFYSFHNVNVEPKPYRGLHPPIRVAAASAETFSMVGKLGYPIFISTNSDEPELMDRLKLYRDALREAGHPDSGDVLLRIPAYVSESAENARSEPEASTTYMIGYTAAQIASAPNQETADRLRRLADVSYEEVLHHKVMYGTPEEVVERIQRYQEELGISGLVLEMNYGGQIPNELVLRSIRQLTEKVMPQFK
jgi:alkanesulfonate monooxygenase SsuD/methylene tetrahydromethanopterin reductase-like flavin-dependent oxidoreductase (luciferase family)